MSQIIKIECSTCEEVKSHEFDGCVVIGYVKRKIMMDRHDITLNQLRELGGYLVGFADGYEDGLKEQG